MELKTLGYLVLGILVLVALWMFVEPRVLGSEGILKSILGEGDDIPTTACYAECTTEIMETGGSLDDCLEARGCG